MLGHEVLRDVVRGLAKCLERERDGLARASVGQEAVDVVASNELDRVTDLLEHVVDEYEVVTRHRAPPRSP